MQIKDIIDFSSEINTIQHHIETTDAFDYTQETIDKMRKNMASLIWKLSELRCDYNIEKDGSNINKSSDDEDGFGR